MRKQITRLFQILVVLVLYTVFKAIELWPDHPARSSALAILLFVVMLSGTIAYRSNPSIFDQPWFRILAWMGSLAMALWITFALLSLPADLVHLFAAVAGKSWNFSAVAHAELVISITFISMGFLTVVQGPQVKRVPMSIDDLPPSLQGLTIVQISDLHVGPTIRGNYVEEVVRRANAINPDLVFLTGDIADAHPTSIEKHLQPLKNLKARYGTYYVTGNHEYYWGAAAIVGHLEQLGVHALLNSNKVITVGNTRVLIAGVTDPAGEHALANHAPNSTQAATSNESAQLKILLAHRPDACIEAEKLGFDLQFSGHTHAGQFFPFSLLIGLAHQYSRGLYRHERMWVYVNPGTGYWGPADRLGVHPEITAAILQAGAPYHSLTPH
ncbi:MAG: metallophosphoesterase [Bdellovibrionales bacterium]|nr:metallophosphoesterase [Bdellovibrionales bacterium]